MIIHKIKLNKNQIPKIKIVKTQVNHPKFNNNNKISLNKNLKNYMKPL